MDSVKIQRVPGASPDTESSDHDSYTLKLWEQELQRLVGSGYGWSSEYTQCVIRNLLHAHERGLAYNPGLCSKLLRLSQIKLPPELFFEQSGVLADGEDLNANAQLDDDEDGQSADDSFHPKSSFARVSFPKTDNDGEDAWPDPDVMLTGENDEKLYGNDKDYLDPIRPSDQQEGHASPDHDDYDDLLSGLWSQEDYDDAYIRGSRFDTKKPGPPVYHDEPEEDDGQFRSWTMEEESDPQPTEDEDTPKTKRPTQDAEGQKEVHELTSNRMPPTKKEWRDGNFEVVDGSRMWIAFEGTGHPPSTSFVTKLEHELQLPRGTFSDIRYARPNLQNSIALISHRSSG